MGKHRRQRKKNSGIKKPCSPPRSQGPVNTGVLTQKIMKQTDGQVNSYSACDMIDAHTLAQQHLKWLSDLVFTIRKNFKCDRGAENTSLLEITEYLAESFSEDHRNKSDQYEIEWKA